MKKSKFNENEIVDILNKGEAGVPLDDLCHSNQISLATYYQWRSKYKNVTPQNLKRIKDLEHNNRKLMRLYVQSVEQKKILQRAIEGKL